MTGAPSPIDWERVERVALSVAARQRVPASGTPRHAADREPVAEVACTTPSRTYAQSVIDARRPEPSYPKSTTRFGPVSYTHLTLPTILRV